MADERSGTRDFEARKSSDGIDFFKSFFAWTALLRTFLVALDPFKLIVAAAGILATALGWWLLSYVFFNSWTEPKSEEAELKDRKNGYIKDGMDEEKALTRATAEYTVEARRYETMRRLAGPGGSYRTMPWLEDRGRNPFLLARSTVAEGATERRDAINWFLNTQIPVLVEPLIKFLSPIVRLFDSAANFWMRIYLFLLILWMLMMWAFFGGIITRMAIVQIAGKEGGGLRDAVRFVRSRYLSYFCSPIVPIGLIFAVVLGCIFFGIFHLIPVFGDIVVDGLFWWIPLGAGFVMALLVVGLVGYPLMYSTLSAEGSDTFDALSRSYNYVYESPWSYLWYGFVSVLYGAIVIFFVVFMSSLMVYLGKWGVSQTPLTQTFDRSPEYLFIYSPTSFGWRELMLQGSPAAIQPNPNYGRMMPDDPSGKTKDMRQYVPVNQEAHDKYIREYSWYNQAGAGMVSFWLTLLFMLMLGFSYSYFWTASSMIYLLMRKKVDEVEVDEIYTEEEEIEEPVPPKMNTASTSTAGSIPIDAPTLRVQTPPASSSSTPALPEHPSGPSVPPEQPPPPVAPPTPPSEGKGL